MKILSYNIHKGLDRWNRHFILSEIRQELSAIGPDVVFLQEVQGERRGGRLGVRSWRDIAQHEYLAAETGLYAAYAANARYSRGHHGNAILSRYPIVEVENVDVSLNPFERRGILYAQLEVAGARRMHCFCAHFDLRAKTREPQFSRLAELIASRTTAGELLLVGGDFNDPRRRASAFVAQLGLVEVHKEIHGEYGRTFPSGSPLFPLDRLYVRGFIVRHAAVLNQSPWSKLSDHCPLYAELEQGGFSEPAMSES